MKMIGPHLCPIPWNHIGIQQNGDLRQCCQMTKNPFGKFISNGEAARFSVENVDLARNHESVKQLRQEMMEGMRPSACQLCWTEEDSGIFSKRLHMLSDYDMDPLLSNTKPDGTIDVEKVPLEYLDLRLGNLCNLRCRSCGPGDSSLWVDDHGELTQKNGKAVMHYYGSKDYQLIKSSGTWRIDSDDFSWHEDPEFHRWFDSMISASVTRLYFTGGEPTVNKHHMKMLDRAIEIGKARNISLEYNTNMVAIPPRLLDQWRHFKRVGLGVSIDAMGPLATYIRNPSKWNDVEANCDSIGYGQIPQLMASIASTISVLNIRHFIDLSKWAIIKRYSHFSRWPSWHMLHGPVHLNVQILPDDIKREIEREYHEFYAWIGDNFGKNDMEYASNYYQGIINFMWKESRTDELVNLRTSTDALDRIRNESLSQSIPWLDEILRRSLL